MIQARQKIVAILGSTKKTSSNKHILEHISRTYRDLIELDIYNRIDRLPHFNPDIDNDHAPWEVKNLREKIRSANGVIICTPEYVFSLPGSLKNAIDWNVSTTLFSHKPVAIIVASASGKIALESLLTIMTTIESEIAKDSSLLIQGVKGKIGKNGEIIDKKTINQIDVVVQSLLQSILFSRKDS